MPSAPAAPPGTFDLTITHTATDAPVQVLRIDDDHSNVIKAFNAMGRLSGDLTQDQVTKLRTVGAMAPAEHLHLHDGKLQLTVPAHGLAVVLIGK